MLLLESLFEHRPVRADAYSFVHPHAACELADCNVDDVRACRRWLKIARKYQHYDFDKPLLRRIKRIEDGLATH